MHESHICYRLPLVSQFHKPSTQFFFPENYSLPFPSLIWPKVEPSDSLGWGTGPARRGFSGDGEELGCRKIGINVEAYDGNGWQVDIRG